MKIDTSKIRSLIENGNLTDVSREIGIPKRTLDNYRYGQSKNLEIALDLVEKMQTYINEEEKEMEKVLVDILELDGAGNIITVDYDINVGEYDGIKEVNKAIEDNYSYFTPRKNTHTVEYLIYKEENDEVLSTIKFEV